jgi:hypothetical protein
MTVTIAVDPGLSGGLAYQRHGKPAPAVAMPSTEGNLVDLLRNLTREANYTQSPRVGRLHQLWGHASVLAPLTIRPESHIDGRSVDLVAKLLLKVVVQWINAHLNSAFSRFMLLPRGPRTDVARMNRMPRLTSALVFLLWGSLFLGLWLLTAYLAFGLGFVSPDNVVVQVLIFGLALLAGCGFVGGLYLLVRVFI